MIDLLPLPAPIAARNGRFEVRRASSADLAAILRLLIDDPVSASRGDALAPDDERYPEALAAVLGDPRNDLLVAADSSETVVATMQLTTIPGLARGGSLRLQVEAVRVDERLRSEGLGSALMRWVMEMAAPAVGASLIQLTSDAARANAHRFYTRLGFAQSHLGFKYRLPTVSRR